MEFTKRPERIQAERWDGSIDSAAKIVEMLNKAQRRSTVQIITDFDGRNEEPYTFLRIDGAHRSEEILRLPVNAWLVVTGGGITYYDDDTMSYLYKKVK